jgi:ferredoxin-NADP reductase
MSAQVSPSSPEPFLREVAPAPIAPSARFVPVQVIGRAAAAREAVTFWLAAPGTTYAPMPYLPGQFMTLAFTPPAQADQQARMLYRSYSLCGDGNPQHPWEITVKRQNAGLVSGFLYEHVRPGMVLYASRPGGNFTLPSPLDSSMSFVFVAAGSGITPLYGMLRALACLEPAVQPQVHLHYAYRSPADAIYARELTQLDPKRRWLWQWHYRSDQRQRLAPTHVMVRLQDFGIQPEHAHWYVCGPDALKRGLVAAATRSGVPTAQLHAETFASPPASTELVVAVMSPADATLSHVRSGPAAPARPAAIRIAETGALLDVQPWETILEVLERHGYQPDFSCRAGSCGTCMLRVLAGRVMPPAGDTSSVLSAAERSAGYVLSCSARPIGEVSLALAGTPAATEPAPSRLPVPVGAPLAPTAWAGSRAADIPERQRTARQTVQRRLRLGVAAASIALFSSVWGLTSHHVSASSSTSGLSLPSLPNLFPSDSTSGSDDGGSSSSSQSPQSPQSPSGPSWFSPQPSPNQPSSGTGVS